MVCVLREGGEFVSLFHPIHAAFSMLCAFFLIFASFEYQHFRFEKSKEIERRIVLRDDRPEDVEGGKRAQ